MKNDRYASAVRRSLASTTALVAFAIFIVVVVVVTPVVAFRIIESPHSRPLAVATDAVVRRRRCDDGLESSSYSHSYSYSWSLLGCDRRRPSSTSLSSSAASRWMEEERRLEDEMDDGVPVRLERGIGASSKTSTTGSATHEDRPSSSSSSSSSSSTGGDGRWEEIHGNYILRPYSSSSSSSPSSTAQPRALIHFLGGAFLGAAPQLTYRYLLERLSSRGYLVVATPYQLSFDHLRTCDEVIGRFELVAPDLAKQYGAVPVVGVGHSCGALLHMLITSLFPDTPRAANALISYNNRGVSEAVPLFKELIVPLFSDVDRNGSELMKAMIEVAREKFSGKVPSDDALRRLVRSLPMPVPGLSPEALVPSSLVSIPSPIRESLTSILTGPVHDALSNMPGNVPSLLLQSLDVTAQVPKLIDEVEGGARDFVPPPDAMSSAARRAYRCRRTLILQFENDALDDSVMLEGYLREAESVMKMKRPMITINLERKVLEGNHLTPLLGPSGGENWGEALEEMLGGIVGMVGGSSSSDGGGGKDGEDGNGGTARAVREKLGYEQVERVVDALVAWLDEGSL